MVVLVLERGVMLFVVGIAPVGATAVLVQVAATEETVGSTGTPTAPPTTPTADPPPPLVVVTVGKPVLLLVVLQGAVTLGLKTAPDADERTGGGTPEEIIRSPC